MYKPHPGELNQPIDIYKISNTINQNGYPVKAETLVCHVWANVKDASSSYGHVADTDIASVGLKFTVRFRPDVKKGMFVLYKGEKHEIETTGEFDHRNTYLELFTKRVEGVSK